MASYFKLLLCISLAVVTVSGRFPICSDCRLVRCEGDPGTLICPFGVVRSECRCCYECRKGPGEECGGPMNVLGTCAEGLICGTGETGGRHCLGV
ncbi:single insulin-like growth factor-binding domain protein-2 isoform X3 [Macrobrachium rosenbergii]|uniref:single insulin-like growth factor-binding domain protein-2 isoform X3 n=1 Tax=Macrobrachium rosenbergii TaxID=79674 RepID=UPI0034D57BA9